MADNSSPVHGGGSTALGQLPVSQPAGNYSIRGHKRVSRYRSGETSHKLASGPRHQGSSREPVIRVNPSRLKNRVPLYKEQTASRRSVENREVRDLHYAALFF